MSAAGHINYKCSFIRVASFLHSVTVTQISSSGLLSPSCVLMKGLSEALGGGRRKVSRWCVHRSPPVFWIFQEKQKSEQTNCAAWSCLDVALILDGSLLCLLLRALQRVQRGGGASRGGVTQRDTHAAKTMHNRQPERKKWFSRCQRAWGFSSFHTVDSPIWVNMLHFTLNSESNNNDNNGKYNNNKKKNENNPTNNAPLKVLCNMLRGSC